MTETLKQILTEEQYRTAHLLGYVELPVHLRDGSVETVQVQSLPLRELILKWPELVQDEQKRIEVLCNKEAGWSDRLGPAAHEMLARLTVELNEPPFFAWAERTQQSMSRYITAEREMMARASVARSSDSSPEAASKPTAPQN